MERVLYIFSIFGLFSFSVFWKKDQQAEWTDDDVVGGTKQ